MSIPLSALDLSPIPEGSDGAQALARTVELAQHCERLGCARFWVAEHHNAPGLASSAPEVMIAHLAASTERIRVGAGGIMLPNHAPLHVAEIFRVLGALHPERIDLGVGRAPGADQLTMLALRRSHDARAVDLPGLLDELDGYVNGFPEGHPLTPIRAVPVGTPLPPIWILGSSAESARVAAERGTGYAFAHYMGPRHAADAIADYRAHFRPSASFPEPRVILGLSAICAESDEEAEHLAWSQILNVVLMRWGQARTLPTPEAGRDFPYSDAQRDQAERIRRAQVLGSPQTVAARITDLVERCAADEAMLMTAVHDHVLRRRSYALIARELGMTPAPATDDR